MKDLFGMMNEDIFHYYQMTTLDAVIYFIGIIFIVGCVIFIVANLLAVVYKRFKNKRAAA